MADLYAIVGIAKLKTPGNIAGVLAHMYRTRETPNSDGRENLTMIPATPLNEIMAEINSCPNKKSNSVLCFDLLLTASPEFFDGKTPEQVKEWAETSLQWAGDKFGKSNIKGAVLHLDECQTGSPHVQICLTAIDPTGRLNARFFTGGRAKLRALWTEYAQAVKHFGLKRGREFSPAKHREIKEFYSDVKRGIELAKGRDFTADELPAPTMGDRLNPTEYAVKLVNHVANYYRKQNGNLRAELEATRRELEQVTNQTANDRKKYQQLKDNPGIVDELQKALAGETIARATEQQKYKRLLTAIADFFRRNIGKHDILRTPEKLGALAGIKELEKDISLSLVPDAKTRQGMTRTRGL